MSTGDFLCESDMFCSVVDAVWVRWWWWIAPAEPGEKGHETELKDNSLRGDEP